MKSLVHLLNHRGPDSFGNTRLNHNNGNLFLLHTRLAIQDLSPNGHQPMESNNKRWVVTFNGEIYNHFQLRKDLDIGFRGTSDTETLVEYLAKFGMASTLEKLNGIFAFAAFDQETQRLYLVRDNFGIKPLYYSLNGEHVTFSSELKPLRLVETTTPQLDQQALDLFLSLRYTPSTNTLCRDIHRLPPGHCLEIDFTKGKSHTYSYVKPTSERFEGSLEEATLGYQEHLARAVQSQLISDVPVGILLSGGVDSAVVAALAKESCSDLSSYTVGFGNNHSECEIDDAAETARTLGIKHNYVSVTPENLLDSLKNIVSSVEEPLGTTSIMPMWYLTEKAKQDVTVVLTGQGNDEPWGGYKRYQIELLLNKFPFLKQPIFRSPEFLNKQFASEAIRRGLRCLGQPDIATRFRQAYALFSDQEKSQLYPGAALNASDSIGYWLDWLKPGSKVCDAEQMMRIDTRMNLADDLLLYGDKISMAFSMEARVPMLDKDLVRFIESLPLSYRTSLRETKIVHKRMAESYLPSSIVHRPKKGFQVPFGDWSKSIWREYIQANLLDKNLKIFNHMSHGGVDDLWNKHLKAKPDYSKQIFALLTLSLWAEEFL